MTSVNPAIAKIWYAVPLMPDSWKYPTSPRSVPSRTPASGQHHGRGTSSMIDATRKPVAIAAAPHQGEASSAPVTAA